MKRLWRVGIIGFAAFAACTFSKALSGQSDTPDADITPDGSLCAGVSTECVGDKLRTCSGSGVDYVDTPCSWGCITGTPARCGELVPPAGAVARADTTGLTTLANLTLGPGTIVNGTIGTIGTTAAPEQFRGSGTGNKNNIEFELRGANVGLFRVKKLTITGDVLLTGTKAIAIVADDVVQIDGVIDARGRCINLGKAVGGDAGPGGFQGGAQSTAATGSGSGDGGSSNTNGGGGGGRGGSGGIGGGTSMAAGGSAFDANITTLVGGGGGGGGGGGANTQPGGGGGGALQLISNSRIVIAAAAGINAGGCGGFSTTGPDAGGGGGAGGTIILEAPRVDVVGTLAVNGGGGGAGENPAQLKGEDGQLSRMRALGATGMGNGGAGGAGSDLAGAVGTLDTKAGGGGGAVGRIRINTRDDMRLMVDAAAILSPNFDDPGTTCTRAAAVVQ